MSGGEFATLHGVVWGARAPMAVSIRADYFGRSNYATIMGFSSLVRMSGMMVGPPPPPRVLRISVIVREEMNRRDREFDP